MGSFNLSIDDSDRYRLAVAGVDIVRGQGQSGLGENTWVKITPAGPSFKTRIGADGAVARARTNNRLLNIEITLLQVSSSNDYFSSLHTSDINLPNGAGVGSFILKALGGTTSIECSKCWIETPAEVIRSSGIEEAVWKLTAIYDIFLVGSA